MRGILYREEEDSETGGYMSRTRSNVNSIALWLLLTAVLCFLVATVQPAHAQVLTTLYSFTGGADGNTPFGSLIKDKAGNLYGTASWGGSEGGNCTYNGGYGTGCGTVFELTRSGSVWSFTLLYSFNGYPDDAANPANEFLAFDKLGNLYGTTYYGGTVPCSGQPGCGTVFKLTPSQNGWTETMLYSFPQGNGAFSPDSGVVVDKVGNLYGTTFHSGTGPGTVYKVTPSGTETVVYAFTGGADGGYPFGGLVLDRKGNLYGTTQYGGTGQNCGGSGCGTVFKIAPDGTETVLYSFAGGNDGQWPWAGVILDKLGNLYGTTWVGGGTGCGGNGCGTVFKLAPDGTETILHSFNSSDGEGVWGGVIFDAKGNLYGTTFVGGAYGEGTVYELTPSGGVWTQTVLHSFDSFAGSDDGAYPHGSLLLKGGILYGTTQAGGANFQGTVFGLNPRKRK
jgi:uncharacterized repeat protein (TIGR03803 family)